MSHKRFVRLNGKNYGPYIYESYRDKNGNVKKRYLGKVKEKKRLSSLIFNLIFSHLGF